MERLCLTDSPDAALRTGVLLLERVAMDHRRACSGGIERRDERDRQRDGPEQAALRALRESSGGWHGVDAFWLGAAYQQALDVIARVSHGARTRRAKGVFYTPRSLVSFLVQQVCPESDGKWPHSFPRTLDPACGCGGFLVGLARHTQTPKHESARNTLASSLYGVDIDPLAVMLCRLGLWLEFGNPHDPADTPERFARQVRVADSLLDPPDHESFDLVLGNPPFLSQLAARTARSAAETARLRKHFGKALRPYTDPAALFLRLAVDTVRPGGRVGMVLPVSVLGSRDAAAIRSEVLQTASIRSFWLDTSGVFDAQVRAMAVTLTRERAGAKRVFRFVGGRFEPASGCCASRAAASSWGPLAADLLGVPDVHIASCDGRTLGDLCEITAGFRDEYYAVTARTAEMSASTQPDGKESGFRRVATVGMLDPAYIAWGEQFCKIAGERRARPGVWVGGGDPLLAALVTRQSRPKLLIATQTRVLEAAADPEGWYVSLTPVITAVPHDARDLWRIGAMVSSPVISAWIAAQTFGTARSLTALKPSAAMLRQIPLPADNGAWQEAGESFQNASRTRDGCQRRRCLHESARASIRSYGVTEPAAGVLFDWWSERLPRPFKPDAMPGENSGSPSTAPTGTGRSADTSDAGV